MNRFASPFLMVSASAFIAWMVVAPPELASFVSGAAASAPAAVTFDRSLKGDRLNITVAPKQAVRDLDKSKPRSTDGESRSEMRKVPEGCEPAASPIASPKLSHIIGSCFG